jgi:hypothetical protein
MAPPRRRVFRQCPRNQAIIYESAMTPEQRQQALMIENGTLRRSEDGRIIEDILSRDAAKIEREPAGQVVLVIADRP